MISPPVTQQYCNTLVFLPTAEITGEGDEEDNQKRDITMANPPQRPLHKQTRPNEKEQTRTLPSTTATWQPCPSACLPPDAVEARRAR